MPQDENHTTVILPTMTYGAETWTLTKQQASKLVVAQRSMEGSLLNITLKDKIRNENIRENTNIKDIVERVESTRGKWDGHLARIKKNIKWTKQATDWTLRQGKRGGPRRRWRDEIRRITVCGCGRHNIEMRGVECGVHLPAVTKRA